ncbi:hypothetical protein [Rhodohalobacter mucosus]|uniref:Uncharacterized protein n=1 Tax=Rhodohalobacter mucosus TaxID=2079485 RepID=A0A316TSU7_9BACT|nr:hypothetical protein [Rhodohalobacter mucosus]PWN06035.1 hypothetical protein DDZ15_12715 [Rhodohalobacter mucosus]
MTTKQVFKNKIFLIGFIMLVIGSGPLIVTMAAANLGFTADPNPNPIVFGMMAGLTFWPGIILMALGIYNEKKSSSGKA